MKKQGMDDYWDLSSPPERVSYLYTRCQELMAYARNRKSEYEQPIVAHCIQVIQECFSDPGFNISQLADRANLSLPYLSTVFKQQWDRRSAAIFPASVCSAPGTAAGYLHPHQRRMRPVGYEDPHYFARSFKKQTGMTPSEYRNLYSSRDLHPDLPEKEAHS